MIYNQKLFRIILILLAILAGYLLTFLTIYMALMDIGFFSKTYKSEAGKTLAFITSKIEEVLDHIDYLSLNLSKLQEIRIAIFQRTIGGSLQEAVGIFAKIVSSVNGLRKLQILSLSQPKILISSELKEISDGFVPLPLYTSITQQLYNSDRGSTFLGVGDSTILYITKVVDNNNITYGILVSYWDLEESLETLKTLNLMNTIKAYKNYIVINPPINISSDNAILQLKKHFTVNSIPISKHNVEVLFLFPSLYIDSEELKVIIILVLLSIILTVWGLTSIYNISFEGKIEQLREKSIKILEKKFNPESLPEEKRESIEYKILSTENLKLTGETLKEENIKDKEKETKQRIIKDIAKLTKAKVMLLEVEETFFIETVNEGFITKNFFISTKDNFYERYLTKGEIIKVSGNIEKTDFGHRLADRLEEIYFIPVKDDFDAIVGYIVIGTEEKEKITKDILKEVLNRAKYIHKKFVS